VPEKAVGQVYGQFLNGAELFLQSEHTPEADYPYQLPTTDAANVSTKNMTQDAHFKIVRMTGTSKKKKHHTTGCEYNHFAANGRQLNA